MAKFQDLWLNRVFLYSVGLGFFFCLCPLKWLPIAKVREGVFHAPSLDDIAEKKQKIGSVRNTPDGGNDSSETAVASHGQYFL